jgi:aspartyl-tRNA(Asn)/glutamyl-tRNA(Gln) amidotransferase subunit C
MSKLGPDDVRRVAKLAAIRLADAEVDALGADLRAMLDYVALLDELDTSAVAPLDHPLALATPLRDDEPADELDPEEVLAHAPARAGTAFAVPQVIDDDG